MAVNVNGMLLEKDQSKSGEALSPDAGTRGYSQVRRWHHPEWSIQRSCSARDRRRCLWGVDPTHALRRSGSGATRGRWGLQS